MAKESCRHPSDDRAGRAQSRGACPRVARDRDRSALVREVGRLRSEAVAMGRRPGGDANHACPAARRWWRDQAGPRNDARGCRVDAGAARFLSAGSSGASAAQCRLVRGVPVLKQLGDVEAARESAARARRAIEELARGSSDWRYLDPWARALLGVGALDEAGAVVTRLRGFGYRNPDFIERYAEPVCACDRVRRLQTR